MQSFSAQMCIALEAVLLSTLQRCSISHAKHALGWALIRVNLDRIQEIGPKVGDRASFARLWYWRKSTHVMDFQASPQAYSTWNICEGVTITYTYLRQQTENVKFRRLCPLCTSCYTVSQDQDCIVLCLKFCLLALHPDFKSNMLN